MPRRKRDKRQKEPTDTIPVRQVSHRGSSHIHIDELISALTQVKDKYGDLAIHMSSDPEGNDIRNLDYISPESAFVMYRPGNFGPGWLDYCPTLKGRPNVLVLWPR